MRGFCLAGVYLISLAAGDDGVPARTSPSDYPVHERLDTAMLAAAIVPQQQVRKIFSADIAKRYIVVEVAVYPEDGHGFDVDVLDFALKADDEVIHASQPREVADVWPEKKNPIGNRGPTITSETGVFVARGTDPATGRSRTDAGTYESVGVSNSPRPADPSPPPRNADTNANGEKVRRMALPLGSTRTAVAGYVYFAEHRRKYVAFTLSYRKDNISVDLKIPK
jgi:hypothetical protein